MCAVVLAALAALQTQARMSKSDKGTTRTSRTPLRSALTLEDHQTTDDSDADDATPATANENRCLEAALTSTSAVVTPRSERDSVRRDGYDPLAPTAYHGGSGPNSARQPTRYDGKPRSDAPSDAGHVLGMKSPGRVTTRGATGRGPGEVPRLSLSDAQTRRSQVESRTKRASREDSHGYGDEIEQEHRLEKIVEDFLVNLGVSSQHQDEGLESMSRATTRLKKRTNADVNQRRPSNLVDPRDTALARKTLLLRRRFLRNFEGCCAATTLYIPVFRPDTRFLELWDAILLLLAAYVAVVLPVFLGWRDLFDPIEPWQIIHVCIDICFLLDICVSLRKGFWKHGMIVEDPYSIAARYANGRLLADAIVGLPFATFALLPAIRKEPKAVLFVTLVQQYARIRAQGLLSYPPNTSGPIHAEVHAFESHFGSSKNCVW